VYSGPEYTFRASLKSSRLPFSYPQGMPHSRIGLRPYSGPVQEPVRNGYSRAVAWFRAEAISRMKLTRQQLSDWRRIVLLGDAWGLPLERLGAPYKLLRWVSGPMRRNKGEAEQRFQAALALLEEAARRGWQVTDREVEQLMKGRPAVAPLARTHSLDQIAEAVRRGAA